MKFYITKSKLIPGTNYKEVNKRALRVFHGTEKQSKRKAYLRSVYFDKEKIFFDFFFGHLNQKSRRDRMRRLKYFDCAIELIINSRIKPQSGINRNNKNEILYKFYGQTKGGANFFVNIKENKKTGRKYFMSCYPENNG